MISFLFLFLGRIFSATSALAAIKASYLSSVEGSVSFVLIELRSGCQRQQHIGSVDCCHITQLSS